jgi:hypothetical protein
MLLISLGYFIFLSKTYYLHVYVNSIGHTFTQLKHATPDIKEMFCSQTVSMVIFHTANFMSLNTTF